MNLLNKIKTKLIIALSCLVISLWSHSVFSQSCTNSLEQQFPGNAVNTIQVLNIPTNITTNKKQIVSASIKVRTDLGSNYNFGRNTDFTLKLTLKLEALDAANNVVTGVFNATSYDLILTNAAPEANFVKDVTSLASASGVLNFAKVKATVIAISNTSTTTSSSLLATIRNSQRIFVGYDINYGYDVAAPATAVLPQAMVQTVTGTREVKFQWNPNNQAFCNYQFQLLRLYNTSESTAKNEKVITTSVDWSQALTLLTESGATSLKLTVAEGQGYYLWRVRPIGNYYPGGVANPLNINDNLWSTTIGNTNSIGITTASFASNPSLFFLEDPDDNINRIYSRVFTEGNKVSETTTYANGLQQTKQTQTYLPSVDTTLVTQQVIDYSGRPSLTTIPAPVDSSMYKGYKYNFLNNESNQLYTSKDYDQNSNLNAPGRVDQINGAAKYYSNNNNQNPHVPSAQGYPYQRTTYYNDGTNRVKEQSGVGKTNMIGTGTSTSTDGEGKTAKTLYGTPSEQELIQLFGDEAPASQNVFKTINVDQNNTASVTLTNKEGKVIATCLSFQDVDNNTVFDPLLNEGSKSNMTSVHDVIVSNTKTTEGFISSKRIALLQTTPLTVGYDIQCDKFHLPCAEADVDCGYKLVIELFNLDNNTVQVLYNNYIKNLPCTSLAGKQGLYKSIAPISLTLEPGSYLLQKKLVFGSPNSSVTASQEQVDMQTQPIIGAIKGMLSKVKCEKQLIQFYADLRTYANDLGKPAFNSLQYGHDFDSIYQLNPSAFQISLSPSATVPSSAPVKKLILRTPCCQNIDVDIQWDPPFTCPSNITFVDKNGNGKLDVRPYNPDASPTSLADSVEFFPDFEGYARTFLRECWDSTLFYDFYMKGWLPGQFNLMIYHMLTDQYNCTNNNPSLSAQGSNSNSKIDSQLVLNSCGDTLGVNIGDGIQYNIKGLAEGKKPCGTDTKMIYGVNVPISSCTQYDCDRLISCWTAQLSALRAVNCLNLAYTDTTAHNVKDKSNEDEPNEFKNTFDKFGGGGVLLGAWLKQKSATDRMSDQSDQIPGTVPQYQQHLVNDFLKCTGYKFAKIITPKDSKPLESDTVSSLQVNYSALGLTPTALMDNAKRNNGDYGYVSLSDWAPFKTIPDLPLGQMPNPPLANSIDYKGMFPFIKNPIYAFKYFEYPGELTVDYQHLEAMTCYSDPNHCYLPNGNVIPCCVTVNSDGTYNTSNCYKDYSYPNLNLLPLDGPTLSYGIQQDASGKKYKLTVQKFCEPDADGINKRISCNYTKESWSCGERVSFYQALRDYQIPLIKPLKTAPLRDCNFYKTNQTWFNNDFTEETGYDKIISQSEVTNLKNTYPQYMNESFTPVSFNNLQGNQVSSISYVESFMASMNAGCKSDCENRRKFIEIDLRKLLDEKCYTVGPCKSSSDYTLDNFISEDDFNAMVDAVINQCQSQCAIASFKCFPPEGCRETRTLKTELGYNRTTAHVSYGAAGKPTDNCLTMPGGHFVDCDAAPEDSLSYCEYTKYKEASRWFIELDIPGACEGNKNAKNFNCAPGNDLCVPRDSYQLDNSPSAGPKQVVTPAIPLNVHVTH